MSHSTIYRNITNGVITLGLGLGLALAASPLQAKPDGGTSKDRLDELEADLVELAGVVDAQATTIAGLMTTLANQVQVNVNQQAKIVSLARYVRNLNARRDYDRIEQGLRERLVKVQDILDWHAQGLTPPTMPANFLVREIRRMRDVTERLRCTIAGTTPQPGDDCLTSTGEVIEEDIYVVEPAGIVVVEGFSSAVSTWSGEVEVTVEQAALTATTPECLLWQADQGNDVLFAFCTASLGIDTGETFTAVLAGMVQASMSLDDYEVAVLEPLNSCAAVIEAGNDAVCTEYEDPANATGSWEGITVQGEASDTGGGSSCSVTNSWNQLTGSIEPSC